MRWLEHIGKLPLRKVMPGMRGRFLHSDTMTFAFWEIDRGFVLPEHSHPHEQVTHMIEGRFELTVEGHSRVVAPGGVAVISSHAPHSGRAITDCRILDVFNPCREDYLF